MFASRTRPLWACLWLQVIVSASLLSMGHVPYLLLAVIPVILWLIYLIRKGKF